MGLRFTNIGSLFAVGLALLAASGSASLATTPPPLSHALCTALNGNVGAGFVAQKVVLLSPSGFNYASNGADNSAAGAGLYAAPIPAPDQSTVMSTYGTVLAAAFNAAPSYLQNALCQNVDFVYIDPSITDPGFAWSYWEEIEKGQIADTRLARGPGSGRGVFIALGTNFLGSTDTLKDVEQTIIQAVLTPKSNDPAYTNVMAAPVVTGAASIDTSGASQPSALAVLAVLAREMGFVIDHELTVAGRRPKIPACPNQGMPADTYYDVSWRQFGPRPELGTVHRLGARIEGVTQWHPQPDAATLEADIRNTDYPLAASALAQIYLGPDPSHPDPEWVGLLSAQAPIEDFVETFRYMVLGAARPPVTSIKIMIKTTPQYTVDIISNLGISSYPRLARKTACMASLLPTLLPLP